MSAARLEHTSPSITRALLAIAVLSSLALSAPSAFAGNREEAVGAARGVALNNATKAVCANRFRVNAREIDEMNRLLEDAFGRADLAAYRAALASEQAKVMAEITAAGEAVWCEDNKQKLLKAGGARIFR